MKRAPGALVAAVFCCLLTGCFCQDPTDMYHGCYFDGVDRRLQDLITCDDGMDVCQQSCGNAQTYCEGETGMTVDFCRGLCRNRNLQYYALQAGSQCFCGGALSKPFMDGVFTGNPVNCSYPCSGDANQTCGGDFKMEVYEFNEPVPGADCFHPGFVPNSFISENFLTEVGERVTYLCEPGHMILGEPQLTCQTQRAWSPNVLPVCNFTGVFPDPTTQSPSTEQPEATTPVTTTLKEVSPTTLPLMTITDPTTQSPSTEQPEATTPVTTTLKEVSPTTLPLMTITGLMTNTETSIVSNSVTTIGSTSRAERTLTTSRPTHQESSKTTFVSGVQTTFLHSTADDLTIKAPFTVKMVRPNPSGPTATQTIGGITTDDTGALLGGKSAPRFLFDFLPYIIGGSATLVFILVICMVAIFTCNSRKRSGNGRQNIRLKPESNPVTFINAGFSVENEEAVNKPGMPDILRASGNLPQSPDHSFMANQYPQNNRVSTFAEEGLYQNGDDAPQSHYANMNEESVPLSPKDSPPSPVYANMEESVPTSEPAYIRQHSGNGYATTDRPNSKRVSSSSNDPSTVYATANRRGKKNGTGTKDLTGWSRPSSLYQRTVLNESSDDDNTAVDPNQLSNALYAEVDKSRQSSCDTLNTMSEDGNSFFGDPAKTSATRL